MSSSDGEATGLIPFQGQSDAYKSSSICPRSAPWMEYTSDKVTISQMSEVPIQGGLTCFNFQSCRNVCQLSEPLPYSLGTSVTSTFWP